MDPLTAIGLASNVLAFVDFASKLIAGSYEVYSSSTGSVKETADLTQVVEDVRAMTRRLGDQTMPARTDDEAAVLDLVRKCGALSDELIETLTKLQAKGQKSKWKSLRVTWRTMREKGNLEAMQGRLNLYQTQILQRIAFMMK